MKQEFYKHLPDYYDRESITDALVAAIANQEEKRINNLSGLKSNIYPVTAHGVRESGRVWKNPVPINGIEVMHIRGLPVGRHTLTLNKDKDGIHIKLNKGESQTLLSNGIYQLSDAQEDGGQIEIMKTELVKKLKLKDMIEGTNAIAKENISNEEKVKKIIELGIDKTDIGISDFSAFANELVNVEFDGDIGFPDYQLKNLLKDIKRLKSQIAELERRDYKDASVIYLRVVYDNLRIHQFGSQFAAEDTYNLDIDVLECPDCLDRSLRWHTQYRKTDEDDDDFRTRAFNNMKVLS